MLTRKLLKKHVVVTGLIAALGFSLGAAGSAFAVINNNIQIGEKPVNIIISPLTSEELELSPGDVYNGEFTVSSDAIQTNEVFAQVAPYSVDKETRLRTFEQATDRTDITRWVTISVSGCNAKRVVDDKIYFDMRPQEECYVSYNIKVPEDAMGGSQNMGIFVQSSTDGSASTDNGGMVQKSYRIGHLIHSTINGPGAVYEGKVLENNIPWLLFDPPLTVDSLVENTGNLDFYANYSVVMKDYFGGSEVYKDSWDYLIMADSEHAALATWEGAPVFGLYQVTQEINLLDDESSSKTQLVLIIPIWLILIILGVIALLIWAVYLKAKERNKGRK